MAELSQVQRQRRLNLQLLIDKYGSTVELARRLGFASQSRVSHLLGTKGMGERAARNIEKRLKLAPGWMDSDPQASPNLPNADWLATIYVELANDKATARLPRDKLLTIIELSYEAALKAGAVEPAEVRRLIALTK